MISILLLHLQRKNMQHGLKQSHCVSYDGNESQINSKVAEIFIDGSK